MNIKVLFCLAAAVCAAACASSPASRFYMLNAIQESAPAQRMAIEKGPVSVCVGPVIMPAYLDRPQLCVRDSGNEVRYAEYHRWAEPLEGALLRVLAENFSLLLGTARIDVFPWKTAEPADYQLRLTVIRFDVEPGAQAFLKAHWSLEASGQAQPVFETISAIVEPVDSGSYAALVGAQNRALERLSREIAAVLQEAAKR